MLDIVVDYVLECECMSSAHGRDAITIAHEFVNGGKQYCTRHKTMQRVVFLTEQEHKVQVPRTSAIWN